MLLTTVNALDEDMKRMKGAIRPTSRYRRCGCGQPFLHIYRVGYLCPACNTEPERYCIDLAWKGERYRICSLKGYPFKTYGRAFDLLSLVRAEIDSGTFDPSNYVSSEIKKFYASTLLDAFLKEKLKTTAPSYHSGYKKQVERAKQYLGNVDVREIRKKDIVKYLEYLKTLEKG